MAIIDFRIRPPYKGFLDTAMYAGAERRDRITRSIQLEPSLAAQQKSVPMMLAEMDSAGIDLGVVVGRNSGVLGSVDNAIVKEFCDAHPGRFIPVASVDPTDRKKAARDIDAAISAELSISSQAAHLHRCTRMTDDCIPYTRIARTAMCHSSS